MAHDYEKSINQSINHLQTNTSTHSQHLNASIISIKRQKRHPALGCIYSLQMVFENALGDQGTWPPFTREAAQKAPASLPDRAAPSTRCRASSVPEHLAHLTT